MNLHLSDWEWLRVVTSLLFIWRGIQDLRDRSGTAWKTEDERKNFRKFSGVTLSPTCATTAAGTTRIKNSFRLLRSLSHPATMRKNAGGILLWSSISFCGS